MGKVRPLYPRQFRGVAVRLVGKSGKTRARIAKDLARDPDKSRSLLRQGGALDPVAGFTFMRQEKAVRYISPLCRVLGVFSSGYYAKRAVESEAYIDSMNSIDIAKLSAEERLELLEQLWDSLSPEALPMTDAQKEELDRRLDELEREGPIGIPWNEVRDRIRNRAL